MKVFNIELKDKKLGRVASEIAIILIGKSSPDFAPNKIADVQVIANNASLLDIAETKLNSKIYDSYSGYPGSRKVIIMKDLIAKKGYTEVLKNAVYGMLPKNKLRDKRINRLIIKE